jgi:tRNA nucleotidyltransferase/poly(A) polymerase
MERQNVCEIKLNDTEKNIFNLLKKVSPNLVLRAAGGWVRDKLLGKESQDIDIVVDGISGQAFAKLVFQYMRENNIPNDHKMAIVKSNPEKSKHLETTIVHIMGTPIDFVQLRKESYNNSRIPIIITENVTAQDDAFRRDFTINTMFYNINENIVEDFTGKGKEDLSNKILRTPLDPKVTFLQDPLRILRGIRFATKYNFEIDEKIIKACNDSEVKKSFVEKLSHERIWKEIIGVQEAEGFKRGFLIGPDPARAAMLMKDMGIRDILFTLSQEEKEFLGVKQDDTAHWDADQNSIHHNLTIWDHSVKSLSILTTLPVENNEVEEIVRNLSILLHDIGKCDLCSRQEKQDGTFSYIGHEVSSAKMAEYILDKKLKAPKEITQRVKNIIGLHMRLHILENNPSNTALRRILREAEHDWKNLIYHSIADSLGKINAKPDPKYINYMSRMEDLKMNQGGTKANRPIDGNVVMMILNIKPGPQVKQVLDALDEVLLENPNLSWDEAVSFIKTVNLLEKGQAFLNRSQKAGLFPVSMLAATTLKPNDL